MRTQRTHTLLFGDMSEILASCQLMHGPVSPRRLAQSRTRVLLLVSFSYLLPSNLAFGVYLKLRSELIWCDRARSVRWPLWLLNQLIAGGIQSGNTTGQGRRLGAKQYARAIARCLSWKLQPRQVHFGNSNHSPILWINQLIA